MAYVAVALLVSLWVLPGLVAALTPIRARDVLGESHDSLITAFIAGDLFIVLPGLMQASRTLLERLSPGDERAGPADRGHRAGLVQLPAHREAALSELHPLRGMVRRRAGAAVGLSRSWRSTGLVTFFGSLNAAVPFLLDLFRIPADTFQLFLATGVINSRVGSLVAAVHTLAVALLVACAVTGHLRWRRGPLALLCRRHRRAGVRRHRRHAALLFAAPPRRSTRRIKVLASMHLLEEPVEATVARTTSPPAEPGQRRGRRSRHRGAQVLRVGYLPAALPFAFFNAEGDLVGFDVELAHRLAREMGVSLAFVPADRDGGWLHRSRTGTATS